MDAIWKTWNNTIRQELEVINATWKEAHTQLPIG